MHRAEQPAHGLVLPRRVAIREIHPKRIRPAGAGLFPQFARPHLGPAPPQQLRQAVVQTCPQQTVLHLRPVPAIPQLPAPPLALVRGQQQTHRSRPAQSPHLRVRPHPRLGFQFRRAVGTRFRRLRHRFTAEHIPRRHEHQIIPERDFFVRDLDPPRQRLQAFQQGLQQTFPTRRE